jgi:hypothetical protein
MGQFKPMVKMMTTEPSVELKLKKGGAVKKAMGGSMIGDLIPAMSTMKGSLGTARGGMDMGMAPKKPSMAKRKKAMTATMKEGGESKAQHKAEMSAIKGVKSEIKTHASKPASKAHKGLATGGVSSGAGGYKAGGIIKSTSGETKMVTAKKNGKSNYATGGVTSGAGGYKKGGKAMMDGGMVGGGMMGNPMMDDGMMRNRMMGGGYKKGGAPKKFAEGGSVQDDGRPQKMPQGNKPPSQPVSITRLAGSFKKGGGVRKMQAGGGAESDYDPIIARENARMQAEKNAERKENEEMSDMILGAPKRIFQGAKRMLGMGAVSDKEPKSVTKTEKSVTVSPVPKKRGGKVC